MEIFLILAITVLSVSAQPGYFNDGYHQPGPGVYGQGYARAFPYSFGYSYVTGGYGNRYHPLQSLQPQFSIAKVKLEQNPLGHEYSVKESGPHHHKHVHHTQSTGLVSVGRPLILPPQPVAISVPVPQVHHQKVPYYPQHEHQHQKQVGYSGYNPSPGYYHGGHGGQISRAYIPLSSTYAQALPPPIVEEYYQQAPTPLLTANSILGGEGQYFYGGQDGSNFNSYQDARQSFPYAYGSHELYPSAGGFFK